MSYLLAQILICLLIAGLIGFIIGWLWSQFGWKKKIVENDKSWNNKVEDLTNQHNNAVSLLSSKLSASEKNFKELEENLKAKLDNSNSAWESKVQALMIEQENSKKELEILRVSLSKAEKNLKESGNDRNELARTKDELNRLRGEIKNLNSKYSTMNSEWEMKLRNLEERNRLAKNSQDECAKQNIELKRKLQTLESKLNTSNSNGENEIQGLMNTNTSSTNEEEKVLGKIDRKHKQHVKGMRKEKKTKRHDYNREVKKVETTTSSNQKSVGKDNKDNLQLIKGIGGVLEKVLNNLGIYKFKQISSWTKEEIDKINEQISFPGRIEREEWIKQAKQLEAGEETEFSIRVKKGDVPTSKDK